MHIHMMSFGLCHVMVMIPGEGIIVLSYYLFSRKFNFCCILFCADCLLLFVYVVDRRTWY